MINSLNQKFQGNSFDCVSPNIQNSRYWQLGQSQDSIEIERPVKQDHKRKNYTAIGLSLGAGIILVAGSVFFILRGGPGRFNGSLQSFSSLLERKIQKAKLKAEQNSFIISAYEFLKRRTNYLIKKTEIINNTTTIKDYATKKIMYSMGENSVGAKIHRGITKMFEKIAKNTVISSYKQTGELFKQTKALSQQINGNILEGDLSEIIKIRGETLTRGQWIEKLVKMNKDIVSSYGHHFSPKNVDSRFAQFSKVTSEVEKEFDKKGFFWFLSKDVFKSFIANSTLLKSKIKIQNEVSGFRKEISYSLEDILKDMEGKLIEITKLVDYKDSAKLKFLRNIREDLKFVEKFKDDPSYYELVNQKISKEIGFLEKLILKSEDIDNQTAKQILNLLSEFKAIANSKQGKVEDILDIYRALLPKSQYEKIKQSYKISISSLDRSINLETQDFISKLRDLTMGSAPTDILTILSGLGTYGYFLAISDDYKERTSVSLKYGIPALVCIGVSAYGNAKLFAGSKSLLLASVSALLTNKLGQITNSILEARWDKQEKLKELDNQ